MAVAMNAIVRSSNPTVQMMASHRQGCAVNKTKPSHLNEYNPAVYRYCQIIVFASTTCTHKHIHGYKFIVHLEPLQTLNHTDWPKFSQH